MAEAAKEAIWMKNFITELRIVSSYGDTVTLYCDNNGTITLIKEPWSHQKSKHFLRRFYLIREIIAKEM